MSQTLHADFETNSPSTQYFVFGAGKLLAAIQWSQDPHCSPMGLLISDPRHFSRKWSTHLFHPEYGLGKTMVTVIIGGIRYHADHKSTKVKWVKITGIPSVVVTWLAGTYEVTETFHSIDGLPAIVREIDVANPTPDTTIEMTLYANPAIFDSFTYDSGKLAVDGYDRLRVQCVEPAETSERTLSVAGPHASLMYSIGEKFVTTNLSSLNGSERKYWAEAAAIDAIGDVELDRFSEVFENAMMGLRAAVSETGKFDASIWQYGYEWSGDAAHVAEALVYSGQFERAKAVLTHILTRLSNEKGMVMESSRFRGGKDSELNNNGAILEACRTYLDWTGDLVFIRTHFPRITAIADYLLLPEFWDPEIGMLRASRDIWERSEAMGTEPGFDLSHQSYAVIGLDSASRLAEALRQNGTRWSVASERILNSMFNHPTHSFVDNGKLIKRRLLNGQVQRNVEVGINDGNRDFLKDFMPAGTPLGNTGSATWEPDICEALPICHELIDPKSKLAKNTMKEIEKLWSQAWEGGGYGRYNVAAEPDSPGPWPFATAFVAGAYAEIGDIEKLTSRMEWLCEKAGVGGAWFEFYGDRPTPPLPPTGIIVWAWAQYITMFVKHVLGVRIVANQIIVKPKIPGFHVRLRFRRGYEEFDT
jgi:hypothetical protein